MADTIQKVVNNYGVQLPSTSSLSDGIYYLQVTIQGGSAVLDWALYAATSNTK